MNATVLAPSVIKTLAKKLRNNPMPPKLTVSRSLEDVSQLLGHPSWHAAQQAFEEQQHTTVVDALSQSKFRRELYDDMILGLEAKLEMMEVVQLCKDAAHLTNDRSKKAVCNHLHHELAQNKPLSKIFQQFGITMPFELLALETGERQNNLLMGMKEARRWL